MNVGSAFNGGGVAGFGYPIGESSEIQVTIAGGLGETDRGGPAFNLVPKTGGNTFSGTAFLSAAGKWSQGENLDARAGRLPTDESAALIRNWDTNFAIGGPMMKDRLWFYNNVRSYGNHQEIPGPLREQECRLSALWIYERTIGSGTCGGGEDDRSDPVDRAAGGEAQGRLLPRLPAGV